MGDGKTGNPLNSRTLFSTKIHHALGLRIFSQDNAVSGVSLKFVQGVGYGFEDKTKTFDGCFWAAW